MRWISFVLSLLLLWACSPQGRIDRALSAAEDVVERRADSALYHLYDIADDVEQVGEGSRALYGLLLTEAKYRQNEDKPDSLLPVILSSEEWFRSAGDQLHQERSMYYHAMMLKSLGKREPSALKLKEGELLAEQLGDDMFLSKYYESLIALNFQMQSYSIMLKYARLFLNHSKIHRYQDCVARGYAAIAVAYNRLNLPDSALKYSETIIPMLDDVSESDRSWMTANIGAELMEYGDVASAEKFYKMAMETAPSTNAYAGMGEVCYRNGQRAKADSLWTLALNECNLSVRYGIMKIVFYNYLKGGETERARSLFERMDVLDDSIKTALERDAISELQLKFDQQVVKNRFSRIVIGVLSVSLFLIIVGVILHYYIVRKFRNAIIRNAKRMDFYEQRLLILSKENEEFKEEISSNENRIVFYEQQLSNLVSEKRLNEREIVKSKQQIEKLVLRNDRLKRELGCHEKEIQKIVDKTKRLHWESCDRMGRGSIIYDTIKSEGRMSHKVDDADMCLIEFYSVLRRQTYQEWIQQYEGVTPRLLVYLILQDMGYDEQQISSVLCVSADAVKKMKSRLKKLEKQG